MEVPLSRPRLNCVPDGALAQLGERRLCKPEVAGSIPARSISKPLLSRRFPLRCHYPPTGSDARSTPERPALASSQARIAASESRARWPYVWSITTDVPISRANSKIETPAASASVANVCRRWYGPRCTIAAARSTTASRTSKRSASATTARREGGGPPSRQRAVSTLPQVFGKKTRPEFWRREWRGTRCS